ncbi:hypothetical protein [Streptomyces sp. CoH27]|uniref:hypothetical protein n=1 Tax=Streptomyces sp. CoH27 TaxID=2875763 RepID=UPI001CD31F40|nr:hypothetical protein [Streptomyces sp. CoH27]
MIAVVGHTDLSASALALPEEEPRSRPAGLARAGRAGLVRAGHGRSVAFGRAARRTGPALVTVLPSRDGLPAWLGERDRKAAGELLSLSQQVRLLEYDPGERTACSTADEGLPRSCARVLAVGDGSPSSGRDTTAHLVACARGHGADVEVLWPRGAERRAVGGEPS